MTRGISERKSARWLLRANIGAIAIGFMSAPTRADESGVSYWLPGRFSSLAAVPGMPGCSMAEVYYHTSVGGSGAVAAAREIQIGRIPANVNVSLNANLTAQADLLLLNPTYTFATPVLGGQLAIGVTGLFGRSAANIDGTLTALLGPLVITRSGSIGDSITSVGDLYPQATLKWNAGVHNFMTYMTGDIPVRLRSDAPRQSRHRSRRDRRRRRLHLLQSADRARIFGRCGIYLQFQEPRHELPERHRFPRRLGRLPVSLKAAFCRSRRIRLSADHRRLRTTPDPWWLPLARNRRGSANRLSVPGRRRHAGLSQPEGIWRVRRGQSPFGMEYLADVLALADGTCEHGSADAANGDEIGIRSAARETPYRS